MTQDARAVGAQHAAPLPGVVWREAQPSDVPLLAHWNKQLIADEGHRNPMTEAQLEARMLGWLERGEWAVWVLEQTGEAVGYATFKPSEGGSSVHLRQFFIARERRAQGLGRVALERLRPCFPHARWTLEVLHTNPRARKFYESLGFVPYCTTLEWNGQTSTVSGLMLEP